MYFETGRVKVTFLLRSQMSRLFRQSPILCCCILPSMFWLVSCGEQSEQAQAPHSEQSQLPQSELVQDPRCKQVTDLFAIADWETLATGPSVETSKSDAGVDTRAPAKSLVAGFKDCSLWRQKISKIPTGLEFFNYICEAPAAGSDDLAAATKALAAEWRSCFAGWQETFKINTSPRDNSPTVTFRRKNDDAVIFKSARNYQTVMNSIWITKTMRKLP
jgi:hypothetical protein